MLPELLAELDKVVYLDLDIIVQADIAELFATDVSREPLAGRLLQFDALSMRFRETRLPPDPDCALCAPARPFPGYIDYAAFCSGS